MERRYGSVADEKTYVGSSAVVTGSGSARHVDYLLTDRLGSVDAVANANGVLTETRGYDAFGKPRTGTWADAAPPRLGTTANTPHGFTGHEHLDSVELIHMNGRVYDYNVGRFTGVDPVIQFPLNSQSLNPYSCILNNPLSGMDPTGYSKVEPCSDGTIYCTGGSMYLELGGAATKVGGVDDPSRPTNHEPRPPSNGAQTGTHITPQSRQDRQDNSSSQTLTASARSNDGNANGAVSDPSQVGVSLTGSVSSSANGELSAAAQQFLDEADNKVGQLHAGTYETEDAAHAAAANLWVAAGIAAHQEPGWNVYKVGVLFQFTYPYLGEVNSPYGGTPGRLSETSILGKMTPIAWVSGGHGHWDENNDFSGTDWNWMKRNSDGNMYLAPRNGNLYKSNWKNAQPYGTGTMHQSPPYTFPGKKVPNVKINTTWP